MSWEKKRIGEICEFKYGKNLPKGLRNKGTVPVYSSAGHIDFHDVAHATAPGIVVGRKGSIGTVYFTDEDYFPIDTCYYIEPDEDVYDIKFLYYNLKGIGLDRLNTDAAVPGLNRENAYSQTIDIPDLPIQQRIASILSAYDDLIENNLKRIKLLEEAAQNIYREWFLHFRFPGYETATWYLDDKGRRLPEGWEIATLAEVAELNYGRSLTAENRNANGDYPVFGSSGIVGYHDEFLVEGTGLILGRKGNVGTVFFCYKNFYPIDTVYYITSVLPIWYMFHYLSNESFVSSDAAVPGLNRSYAYSKEILKPAPDVLEMFNGFMSSFFLQIDKLLNYNISLKEARDILLPRLMNQTIMI